MRSDDLPDDWTLHSLKDVAADVRYGYTASATAESVGPRFLRITDIVGNRLDWAAVPHCEIDQKSLDRHRLDQGDIVVARTGASAGATHYCEPPEPAVFASYLVRFRIDGAVAEPRYVAYALQSPAWSDFVASSATGSAQPQLNATIMGTFRFPLPPIREQKRIAAVLAALDDKIDSNRRLCVLLRDVADCEFSHARSSADVATVARLGDLATVIKRGITPKYCDDGVLVLNQRCVRGRTIEFGPSRRHNAQARSVADDRMLRLGDVLVNSTGVGTLGRVAVITWLDEETTVDSHVTVVRPDAARIAPAYLAWELMSRQPEIEALAEGSTGQTELSRSRLADMHVSVPMGSAQAHFAAVAAPVQALSAGLEQESLTLERLRAALLPKLISGEIRVLDIADPNEPVEPVAETLAAAS